MPPGEGALAVRGVVTPPLYRRLLRFFAIGVESESSPVMFLVVMPALGVTTEELGVKISIELDRKDVLLSTLSNLNAFLKIWYTYIKRNY